MINLKPFNIYILVAFFSKVKPATTKLAKDIHGDIVYSLVTLLAVCLNPLRTILMSYDTKLVTAEEQGKSLNLPTILGTWLK